jgi:hypothetical protein
MRLANFILAAVFALFAIVQYNDPDPLRWILLYGFIALVSLLAGFRRYYPIVLTLGVIVCVVWALSLFPSVRELFIENNPSDLVESMQAKKPYIEGSRESFGLLLSAAVLIFQMWSYRRLKRRTP